MNRKLACLSCLIAFTLSALALDPPACGGCKEITGEGTASKDDSYGIEVIVYNLKCQGDTLLHSQVEFIYVRKRVDSGKEETLAVDNNTNAIYDATAEKDVLYEYIIYIRFKDEGKKIRLATPGPIEGLRPSKSHYRISLDYMKGTHLKDTCVLIWEFLGIDRKDIQCYYLEITSNPNHTWSPRAGFSGNPAKSFSNHTTKENWLKLPNRLKIKKFWVCIRVVHQDGSSQFFHIEVPVATSGPIAFFDLNNARDIKGCLEALDKFQEGKYYGLSYIPETSAQTQEGRDYPAIAPEEFRKSPSVLLDHYVASYLEKQLSARQGQAAPVECLEPFFVSDGNIYETQVDDSEFREGFQLAFESNCSSYELNAMKILIRNAISEDGFPDKKVIILPNKYATIEKYQKTRGLFVWTELPDDYQLNNKLIRTLQKRLTQLGFYRGKMDGTFNLWLRIALLDYQKSRKLPIGNLDVPTIKSLGIDLE
ncbi:MAG: peptidoglycan-binding protein [Lewinellaceae bacterium]|nr:peptidoglycan-binding protein [Lewinellaceae bacterium]